MDIEQIREEVRDRLSKYLYSENVNLESLSVDVTNIIQELKSEGVDVCCDYTGAAIEGIRIRALLDGTIDVQFVGR